MEGGREREGNRGKEVRKEGGNKGILGIYIYIHLRKKTEILMLCYSTGN